MAVLLFKLDWLDVVRLKEGWLGIDLDVMCSSSLFRLIGLDLIGHDWIRFNRTGFVDLAKGKVTKTCTTSASNTIYMCFFSQSNLHSTLSPSL